ncbi:MAG TPA: hypothetical protein VL633_07365 [Bacteroidota bacterium]|jgi:hypothetical protein|nr:hypothetical protein [Bacteroidota bacterium]
MRRFFPLFFVLAMWASLYAGDEKAHEALEKGTRVLWAKKALQGFTMQMWISNQLSLGQAAWQPNNPPIDGPCERFGGGLGLVYPVGSPTCIEHLFGAGPMIGGLVQDPGSGTYVRRVSEGFNGSDSRTEFFPEIKDTARDRIWVTNKTDLFLDHNFNPPRVLSRPVNQKYCDDDGDGKVDEDELDGMDNDGDWVMLTDDIGTDGIPDSLEVGCKGAYDPVNNPDPAYDNYEPLKLDLCHPDPNTGAFRRKNDKNLYTEKNGLPDHGEPHVDEDYGAVSDNDLYLSVTDTATSFSEPGHIPMGIKVSQKSYAWRGAFADGILPLYYDFINIGKYTIKDVYVSFFADMDVGPVNAPSFNSDDYACYIPDLRTAYIHNAIDRGTTPLGITVLGTSVPLDQLRYIFHWDTFNAMGTNDSIIYSWMNAEHFGGELIEPCQSPENPNDISLFFSFGPFNGKDGTGFKPGDTISVAIAFVAGEAVADGPHNLVSNAQNAIKLFKTGNLEPIHLPSPKLTVETGYKKNIIRWFPSQSELGGPGPYDIWDDSNKIAQTFPDTNFRRINPPCGEGAGGCSAGHACTIVDGKPYLPGGRIFEGFRLYRSEDPITTVPNAKNFTLLKQYDIADGVGFDSGIDSVFVDSNLTRGKRYWYAVTTYGLPDITLIERSGGSGTAFDTLYTENTESTISENAKGVDLTFSVSSKVGDVLVVPNPYRIDQDYTFESGGWEGRANNWTENNRKVKFIHLPKKCTIRVFTLAGDLVTTIEHDDPVVGEVEWDLLSGSYRALASGLYIFSVESDLGTQIGKFALIR